MLLGIYDDLLLGGTRNLAGLTGKLYFSGLAGVANTPAPILVTSDLLSWQTIATPVQGFITGVAVGNETMIAVGQDFGPSYGTTVSLTAIVSKDGGATWTRKLVAMSDPDTWGRGGLIAFGRGVFVNVGLGGNDGMPLWSSPDGVTWTKRAAPFVGSVKSLTFVNGRFFLCGYDTVNRKPAYAVSTDGVSFVRSFDIFSGTVGGIARASFVNGFYVLEASPNGSAEIAFSTDLANWTRAQLPWPPGDQFAPIYVSITYFNGLYWATGSGSSVANQSAYWASSPDLRNWTLRTPAGANVGATDRLFNFGGKLVTNYLPYVQPASQNLFPGAGFVYNQPTQFGLLQSTDGASFAPVSRPNALYSVTFAGLL